MSSLDRSTQDPSAPPASQAVRSRAPGGSGPLPDPADPPAWSIESHRLGNGLTVLLSPDRRLPLVALNLWYHVGSKNERPGRTGFAHLFEHMLFQGSEHVTDTDHFRYIQQVGGVANGSTWYDRTNYYETLPSSHLDLGLWLESDRMGFLLPALTPEKLANQRDVVMNERRERVDNQPYGQARERLYELMFPEGHPYRWPVIGTMEDIAAATLEDVEAFFQTWYTPNNAVLTLVGDFEPEQALEQVDHWFGGLDRGPEVAPVAAPEARFDGVRRQTLEDDVGLPRVYLAFHEAGYGATDWYAADLLAAVLTGGKSSLLHRELVHRRELARSISSSVPPTELSAMVSFTATANPEVAPEALEGALVEHLETLAQEGPAEDDLERARNRLLTALHGELQTLSDRADLISQCATYLGAPERALSEALHYDRVTAEEVRRTAERWLEGGRGVVTVVPRNASRADAGAGPAR